MKFLQTFACVLALNVLMVARIQALYYPLNLACVTQDLASNNNQYVRTTVDNAVFVFFIALINQVSNSPCTEGVSFGSLGPDVFVDRGCRGTFKICFKRGTTVEFQCNSVNFQEMRCDTGAPIRLLTLKEAPSTSPCIEGFSYSIDGNFIVVSKGCRATFLVGR